MIGSLLAAVGPPTGPGAAVASAVVAHPAGGTRGGCTGHVALTFDDGPAPGPTGRVVRLLREAHAPATFFMVGQRVAAAPRLARHVERSGFLIANHTWAHVDLTTQTATEVEHTLRITRREEQRAGTHPTNLMRPPYGAIDDEAHTGIRNAGLVPVLWTIDPRNWEGGTTADIAARILSALRPGDNIVLQHDGVARSAISVEAVPTVVRVARRRGYCFTALDESGRPGFPTPRVSVTVTDVAEGEEAVARVRLSKPAGRATSVRLRTRSRTAVVGQDLTRIATRLEVPAGRLSAKVRIPVRRDGIDEPTEEFAVRLTRPHGLRLGTDVAIARISDQDPRPVVRGVDLTVTEPATDTATASVVFRLSRTSGRQVRVVLRTVADSADGSDFVVVRRRFDIAPGTTSVLLPVTVLADALDEPAEAFSVVVVRAVRLRIGRSATVTIAPPTPGLSLR